MLRIYLIAAAAGVFLAMASFAGWQSWRLENAREELGQVEERFKLCTDSNQTNQDTIDRLRGRLDEVVRKREIALDEAGNAVTASEQARERVQNELSETKARLQALWEGDCAEYGRMPVCPALDRQLRR